MPAPTAGAKQGFELLKLWVWASAIIMALGLIASCMGLRPR
jgi:hypothetical protein